MNPKVCVSALALLAMLGEGGPAFGQTVQDDVITITAGRAPGAQWGDRPVVTLDAEALAASGLSDLGDALAFSPAIVGSEFNDDPGTQNDTSGTSSVNLRGLGLGATLVLVNGVRQAPASVASDDGASFVDMNALVPDIAIGRVEILKDGASPLHGSDAVAGVVNVITDDFFEGVEVELEARGPDGFDGAGFTSILSARAGEAFGAWNVMGAVSYRDTDGVEGFETDFIPGTGLSALGQPGAYYILAPGGGYEVTTPSGGPQVIIDRDCAAAGGQPLVLGADTAFGTPGYCRLDYGQFFSLIPDETRLNLYGALTGDFGDTRVTLRAAWADTQLTRGNSPSLPALSFPTIPVTHPGNYFGRDVTWNGRPRGVSAGAARRSFDHDTLRLEAGLAHDIDAFARDWTAEATLAYSRNELEATITDHIGERLDAALNGFGGANCQPGASAGDQSAGCFWFNPFGSGSLVTDPNDPRYNDPALLDWMLGEDVRTSTSELTSLDASLTTGHLFALPAGSVSLTVGAQLRNERLDVNHGQTFNDDAFLFIVGGPDYSGERDVASLFAESVIPLHERARLTLAARYEDLEDFSSTDPKIALAVDVTDALTLSASWAQSFRAPSLHQQVSATTTLQSLTIGNQSLFRPVRTVGSQDLDPESSDSYSLGASWRKEGWTARVDAWRLEVEDLIIEESANAILAADIADDGIYNNPRVELSQAGDVVLVRANFVNAPRVEAQGVDVAFGHDAIDLGRYGMMTAGLEAVYIDEFTLYDPVLDTEIEAAGNRNFTNFARSLPQWRASVRAGWMNGSWSVNAQARYISSYDDENGGAEIDSWTAYDLQAGWTSIVRGHALTASVGALNLFDEAAPHVNTPLGYDTKVHDARGRVLYARISVQR